MKSINQLSKRTLGAWHLAAKVDNSSVNFQLIYVMEYYNLKDLCNNVSKKNKKKIYVITYSTLFLTF